MALPILSIIPAGAGSGKTHTIQTHLADWVVSGEVAPDRILAVTFTEAAASELKARIRYELIRRGRIEDALRLEQSYISTIHGFGLRLLTEFAFEGGISPAPRLLDDDERNLLIRKELSATDKADLVTRDLEHFGYRRFDPVTEQTAEDTFRKSLLGMLDRLRTLGPRGEDPVLVNLAGSRLASVYGSTGNAAALEGALLSTVKTLLARHPSSYASLFPTNATASGKFGADFRNLKRAPTGVPLSKDWRLWVSLQGLRCSMKGAPTPGDYDQLAGDVITAANDLAKHPGPLADALVHAGALLGAAQEIIDGYSEGKRENHLLDYADMVTDAWKILAGNPGVLSHLKNRLDCFVIDEFQDTNPMQFSLLWTLHAAGVPSLIVGDLKQAIMGFQNADPRLFEALQRPPELTHPCS